MNVIEFKSRPKPAAPVIEAEVEHASMQDSAASLVVATLAFYANQGFDHGAKARQALAAMNILIATKQ